jgi:acetylornithine deacetylase/succinyl-diaminopimelate desuccinylase-like protein
VGPTARNIIPTRAEATLDVRLVKGNDPERMLDRIEAHIAERGYTIVREDPDHHTRLEHPRLIKIVRRPGYPAVRTPLDMPVVAPIIAAAGRAAGEPVILMPTLGGSLPLYLFTEDLGDPIVVVPIANHDDNQHAPDENMRIGNLWYGIRLFAAIFSGD